MSRGRFLTDAEIEYATWLRERCGMRWREIGKRLGRDHSGLCRACGNVEPARITDTRMKRRSFARPESWGRLPYDSPLHPRNAPMTGI